MIGKIIRQLKVERPRALQPAEGGPTTSLTSTIPEDKLVDLSGPGTESRRLSGLTCLPSP
jgi:hypothetical protein